MVFFIYFVGYLSLMVRSIANSDGCSAVVLERMLVDPRAGQPNMGRGTLAPWLNDGGERDRLPAGDPLPAGSYPTFDLGSWRFTVKTADPGLIEELSRFAGEIAHLPRADARFTFKLVFCTEEGRLGGWAWRKERVAES